MSSLSSIVARTWSVSTLIVAVSICVGVGCGGGGGGAATTAGSEADTTTLAGVPTVDVSSYDPSTTSSASSSESALFAKSLKAIETPQVENKNDLRPLNHPSRAGCEQNMHKKEIIRNSQTAQMDRCYIQAFEKAGIITIPTDGTRKAYLFKPPAEDDSNRSKKCEGIPAERTAEKEACLTGGEGPTGGVVAARVGIIDGALQIDVCSGRSESALSLENESSYTGGSSPTFSATRIGAWQGKTEKGTISGTVSGSFSISDGDVTLGDTGTVSVAARMEGGPGSGSIAFEANPLNYAMSGGFKGSFKDPFSASDSSFTGVAYAIVGKQASTDTAIKGTAKFSYTGAPPAMPLRDMMPLDVSGANLETFIKMLATEMGINVTVATLNDIFVCPNKDFDPEHPSITVKPMVAVARGTACESVTHTGVESFEVSNLTERGNFGNKRHQTFKRIADAASPFYTAVNAKDLSTIDTSAGTIAFARNWDCTGISGTLDMSNPASITAELASKLEALQTGMEKCSELEEKLRDNEGMGEHNCGGKELSGAVENTRNTPPSFGNAGGEYAIGAIVEGVSCKFPGQSSRFSPERIFINLISEADKKYCFPNNGGCTELVVNASTMENLNLVFSPTLKITKIVYGAGTGVTTKATTAAITFLATGEQGTLSCTDNYTISQPSMDAPTSRPSSDSFPDRCKSLGITDPDQCADICRRPESKCFES